MARINNVREFIAHLSTFDLDAPLIAEVYDASSELYTSRLYLNTENIDISDGRVVITANIDDALADDVLDEEDFDEESDDEEDEDED